MNDTAYLIAAIDRRTGELKGVDIFSEPCPTMSMRYIPAVVLKLTRSNYDEAHDAGFEHASIIWPEWRRFSSRDPAPQPTLAEDLAEDALEQT